MQICKWECRETDYCLTQLTKWRQKNFRDQEALIIAMQGEGNLPQAAEEIRMRMECLDRLANGELSDYELLTIPEEDRFLNGICKKR